MKKDNSKLFDKIMETVSEQVKQSLNEFDEVSPVKPEVTGEVYLVRCDGINKKVLDTISKQLPAFDNYGAGAIKVTCKTHKEVVNVITLLVNANVLDVDNALGQAPRISIQKVNKNIVNDSVNEGKSTDAVRQYIQVQKIKTPRQKAKFDLIIKILAGEIERTPEAIKKYFDETGLWADRSEARVQMDIDVVMKKTQPEETMEGDFITDFTFSKDSYETGEFASPMEAAKNHVKWLINHGLTVDIQEKRYSFYYYIHYSTTTQFNDLVKWMAWHCGWSESPNNVINKKDKEYFEEMIKSGKKTTW